MYADPRRHPVNFEVGDSVYLKVSPWKGVIRFGKRGKLAPRYIGPLKIIQRVNDQTVVLELPTELIGIHNTFNVCYLRKCKVDDETQKVPLSDLRVDLNQKLVEELVRIVDRKIVTRVTEQFGHQTRRQGWEPTEAASQGLFEVDRGSLIGSRRFSLFNVA
ncbi:uncharacterized protein [Rutidosis leptorrhynchoides]|uniref:uncharacterized protein n=1 Tax=Rutidosis leptorrhynchoides TaxID=125765 RepID=UPI003A9A4822